MHFTLTDLVADITQNGAESGADLLELEIRETADEFRFVTRDNGKGMSEADLKRAMDPFVTDGVKHPGRKVGLGLPFLIQTASMSGGGCNISSAKEGDAAAVRFAGGSGHGTLAEAWFDLANVDTPPVGDLPGLFRTILMFNGPAEIVIHRTKSVIGAEREVNLDYEIRKTELMEALGDLEDASSLILLTKYLKSFEEEDE